MRRAAVCLAAVLFVAPARAEAPARLAATEVVASNIRLLEAWIESHMAYRQLPGLAIAVVHDQEVVWAKGFGHADVENKVPMTPATLFRVASISKLFTGTAVMRLRDQGRLNLDDPVDKYLPWFKLKNPSPDTPITIRHLLTHTAGLPRESAFPYWTDATFPTREQMIEALRTQETAYPPETRWKYSNLGLAIAGEVVAAVSGEPYETYVTKQVLQPLGMRGTSVVLSAEDRKRLAVGYGRRMPDGTRAVRPFSDTRAITPAANLTSTVDDLAKFVSFQFRAGRAGEDQIVKPATLREMHRVHWLMPDWKSGRGLGFSILHRDDGDIIGHGGWLAGYQSALYFRPKDRVGVVAVVNADDGLPYPGAAESVVDRAFKWVGSAIDRARPAPPDPKPKPEWQKYVGKYRSPWGDTQVLVHQGRLVMIDPTDSDPLGGIATLIPLGEHTFRVAGGPPGGAHGERVVFEMKDDAVVRVKIGENYVVPQR